MYCQKEREHIKTLELTQAPVILKQPPLALKLVNMSSKPITTQMALIYADGFNMNPIDAWLVLDSLACDPQSDLWVLKDNQENTIVLATIERQDQTIWLRDFVVGQKYRRQGFAQHFMQLIYQKYVVNSNKIKTITLKVRSTNSAAINLYKVMGFKESTR